MFDLKEHLRSLVDAHAPSGHEAPIREIIRESWIDYVNEYEQDKLGSLIGIKKATTPLATPRKIMLAAHMDEIGLIVTQVEKEGFARFTNIGGLQALNLSGTRVIFNNGAIGMINVEDAFHRPNIKAGYANLYIDLGVSSREECPIKVGDVAAFYGPSVELGERMMAKSMDDRIGCACFPQQCGQLFAG